MFENPGSAFNAGLQNYRKLFECCILLIRATESPVPCPKRKLPHTVPSGRTRIAGVWASKPGHAIGTTRWQKNRINLGVGLGWKRRTRSPTAPGTFLFPFPWTNLVPSRLTECMSPSPYKTLARRLIHRFAMPAVAFVAICYAILYGWQLAEYLHEHDSWRYVCFAIDRRGPWSCESILPLALSSSLITVIGAFASAPHLTIHVRFNLLLSIPIVSYTTALACYAPYEAFLVIHLFHALYLVVFLSWTHLLRSLPLVFEGDTTQSPTASRPLSRSAICATVLLILFCGVSINFDAVWQAIADPTQIGASASGPIFQSKFNLWSVLLANAHATVGALCVWAFRSIDRWTIFRFLLFAVATVAIPTPVVNAFQEWEFLWPMLHSYDPAAFTGMLPEYLAWFVLTSVFASLTIGAARVCGLLGDERHN